MAIHEPGTAAPYTGIYRCPRCGLEIISEKDDRLPAFHGPEERTHEIQWQLLVKAKVPRTP